MAVHTRVFISPPFRTTFYFFIEVVNAFVSPDAEIALGASTGIMVCFPGLSLTSLLSVCGNGINHNFVSGIIVNACKGIRIVLDNSGYVHNYTCILFENIVKRHVHIRFKGHKRFIKQVYLSRGAVHFCS